MSPSFLRRVLLMSCCGVALAACSGGSTAVSLTPPTGTGPATDASLATLSLGREAKPATFIIAGQRTSLGFTSAKSPNASLFIEAAPSRNKRATAGGSTCATYMPPVLDIANRSAQPIVLTTQDLQHVFVLIITQCNVVGDGYNVALTQTLPFAAAPVTVGDVKGSKLGFGFYAIGGFIARPNASYTFAANSTTQLALVPAAVNPATGYPYGNSQTETFPPNQQTTLGSVPTASCSGSSAPSPGCPNGSATQTSVAIDPQNSSGGSASVSCFNTTDPRFAAIPPSAIAAFPGTVKGACDFNTGSATITLGTTVTFTITNPDPDTAHGFLEGPYLQIPCTQTTSGNTITATCPTTGPNGNGFTIGTDSATQYQYFLFGNDPYSSNVQLSPSWVSVVAGTASSGYTFALPTFASYPVTMTIDGDVNGNLSMVDGNPIPCTPGGTQLDMTQVAPGSLRVNCNTGHQQGIVLTYNGNAWQYQHNGIAGQNQDCDASCAAYAAIDLYDATGKTLLQGDGPGATINGTSTALATIDPLAVIDPATGILEDANAQTVTLPPGDADPTGNTATVLKVTEANLNALDDTSIVFNLRQPTNGAEFGLNVYYGGSSFVTTGSPALPVGSTSGLAHIPYGVGLNIQANQLGGTGLLFISPPEPAGSHAPPSGIINVVIPQASEGTDLRRRTR